MIRIDIIHITYVSVHHTWRALHEGVLEALVSRRQELNFWGWLEWCDIFFSLPAVPAYGIQTKKVHGELLTLNYISILYYYCYCIYINGIFFFFFSDNKALDKPPSLWGGGSQYPVFFFLFFFVKTILTPYTYELCIQKAGNKSNFKRWYNLLRLRLVYVE